MLQKCAGASSLKFRIVIGHIFLRMEKNFTFSLEKIMNGKIFKKKLKLSFTYSSNQNILGSFQKLGQKVPSIKVVILVSHSRKQSLDLNFDFKIRHLLF